jgi:P-type E1-E2 ATPase
MNSAPYPLLSPPSSTPRLLVRLVRRNLPSRPVVLAIGDGANDVAMIQEADIGELRGVIILCSSATFIVGTCNILCVVLGIK